MKPISHPVFSKCKKYRYTLHRKLEGNGPKILFVGINPSYANEQENDLTVSIFVKKAKSLNASELYVANIFNFISPDIGDLNTVDPFGPDHYLHLDGLINQVDLIILCWGARSKLTKRFAQYFDEMRDKLILSNKPLKCYGFTEISKDPVHLQRLSRDAELIDFN